MSLISRMQAAEHDADLLKQALDAERAAHLATRQELSAALARLDDATAPCHGLGCGRCESCVSLARAEIERLKTTAFTAQNAAIDLAQQVERLTRERDEARNAVNRRGMSVSPDSDTVRLMRERDAARAEVERLRALHDLAHAAKAEAEHAANVAREEVERLRADLLQIEVQVSSNENEPDEVLAVIGRIARAALARSPVSEGSPQTPRKLDAPVEYVPSLQRMTDDVRRRALAETICFTCKDTHRMKLGEREVMCTHCPSPCESCRAGGKGAYCEKTPCSCGCHDALLEEP